MSIAIHFIGLMDLKIITGVIHNHLSITASYLVLCLCCDCCLSRSSAVGKMAKPADYPLNDSLDFYTRACILLRLTIRVSDKDIIPFTILTNLKICITIFCRLQSILQFIDDISQLRVSVICAHAIFDNIPICINFDVSYDMSTRLCYLLDVKILYSAAI